LNKNHTRVLTVKHSAHARANRKGKKESRQLVKRERKQPESLATTTTRERDHGRGGHESVPSIRKRGGGCAEGARVVLE